MLSSARKTGSGGGPPGADSPTHRINSAKRGANAVSSLASASSEEGADINADGFTYPEWDAQRKSYRSDWCTVREVEPRVKASAPQAIDSAIGVRRPLARLGMGLHRRHRQSQGDDIDIDAAIEARVEVRAGSVPDEDVYLDSLRRRRDLSVLLLLDVSGSTAEPGTVGRTVHEQQRRRWPTSPSRCTIWVTGSRCTPTSRRAARTSRWCRSSGSMTTSTHGSAGG